MTPKGWPLSYSARQHWINGCQKYTGSVYSGADCLFTQDRSSQVQTMVSFWCESKIWNTLLQNLPLNQKWLCVEYKSPVWTGFDLMRSFLQCTTVQSQLRVKTRFLELNGSTSNRFTKAGENAGRLDQSSAHGPLTSRSGARTFIHQSRAQNFQRRHKIPQTHQTSETVHLITIY